MSGDSGDRDRQADLDAFGRIADALASEVRARRNRQSETAARASTSSTAPIDMSDARPSGGKQGGGDYPDHFNLRLRPGDRQRFRDFAWRQRVANGEAFKRLLDAGELLERWNAPTMPIVDQDE